MTTPLTAYLKGYHAGLASLGIAANPYRYAAYYGSKVSPEQVPHGQLDQFGIQTYVAPDAVAEAEASNEWMRGYREGYRGYDEGYSE